MNQRQFAIQIVSRLQQAGFQALWAGGCVRDQLLGLQPKDYDVATDATPEQVRDLFGYRKTLPIGAAFGVISVIGPPAAGNVEVATFRTDEKYSDGRRPDSVIFSTPEEDARRRDFTINGIFYDPIRQQVIDYVDGQQDLKHQVVRAIGNPLNRIEEDKLRMLRGVRFAATFNFTLEPATQAAITQQAPRIREISAERIGMELVRILACSRRARGVALLMETGLLEYLLPSEWGSASPERPGDRQLQLVKLERLVTRRFEPGLYLLVQPWLDHFCPPCPSLSPIKDGDLDGETGGSPQQVLEWVSQQRQEWMERGKILNQRIGQLQQQFRLTNQAREELVWIANAWPPLARADQLPWAMIQPLLIHPAVQLGLAVADACEPDNRGTDWCRLQLKSPSASLNPEPLISGEKLIALGFRPGPDFKILLQEVRDRQLQESLQTAQQAQDWVIHRQSELSRDQT
jgi:poly(A) polymerase